MSQKSEWDAFREEVEEKDYAWAACYQKAKKKRKHDYGRILAIAIVVAAILYRILHIFMVDILWNPNEYWGGQKLTVERQGREDALFSAWALWEQWDQTVRWFFVGDIYPGPHYHYMETEEITFDGVEMEDSFYTPFNRVRQDVLFLDGSVLWMNVDEDVNEITVRIKNDTFTIHLDEVRP